jgi:2'-5' RNA ligase
VGVADLHVTLAFLGWRPLEQADELWRVAAKAVAGMQLPRFEPIAIVPVPRRRPRLLALDLGDPTGAGDDWHGAVSGGLSQAGLLEPEARPFWPHVTVARGRKGARVRAPGAGPELAPFAPTALTLYRSLLSPAGARYMPLRSSG